MNLKNKKTVLSDEAAIYKHSENVSEKEKWESMSKKERWQYFTDYYLARIVVTIIVIAVVGSILYTMLTPKPEVVFSVAIVNDAVIQLQYEDLQEKFNGYLELDTETEETRFDTGYHFATNDYESWQKFSMYNVVGDLDVTILPRSVFEDYAPGEYFSPIAGHLPTDLYMSLSEYMLETKVRDEDGNLIPDSETVFGILLESSWFYEEKADSEPMVLTINLAPDNKENIEKFLRFLFSPDM